MAISNQFEWCEWASCFLTDLSWLWLWPFLWSGVSVRVWPAWHFQILRHFKLFDLLCAGYSALHKKHSHKSQGETVNIRELFVGFIGAKSSSINQINQLSDSNKLYRTNLPNCFTNKYFHFLIENIWNY